MNSVVLVIVMLLASHVNSSPILNFSWDTPRHFCGSQLANVLALICKHGYNFHTVSEDVTARSRRRKRVPIVQECCENTCTPIHLKSYCWQSQRLSDLRSDLDPSVEKPSVDKIAKTQNIPASNTLSQRKDVVDNSLLIVEPTTAKPKSNSIIPNSKEHIRQTNIKYNTIPYVPKKESMIVQDPSPGRVKTVTPYFDKIPSVIITKTQH
ncbi:Insulin-like,Insulin family,Insulin, conserved site [Cinara cedri]|uniref:Insulin-like,Insulin family,Insulin, conserved site n=1 Tax=Cinara cedri TaxID=506608 RepID=A0A5E4NKF1_9HEMI|nr:Insulin-like,Insulin family,Insulin, conserved site [Cinara cedri]